MQITQINLLSHSRLRYNQDIEEALRSIVSFVVIQKMEKG